jgi:hypothetical protein
MPQFLKKVLGRGAYSPEEVTEVEKTYFAICSELGIAPDDERSRTTIAYAVIEQIHNGRIEQEAVIETVQERLAPFGSLQRAARVGNRPSSSTRTNPMMGPSRAARSDSAR